MCLLYKRLHHAVFALPRATDGVAAQIAGGALAQLLAGVARAPRATAVNR